MDVSNKTIIKKTNPGQFKVLVQSMEEFPEFATSSPIFGKTKEEIEGKWDLVAQKINAIGPPTRSALDWKKVWADLKCRTKAKIAENAKQIKATGGGPSCSHSLTDLENDIYRICHLSAAVPFGNNAFGVSSKPTSKKTIELETTPPRLSSTVAVVTPTSSKPQYEQLTSTPICSEQSSKKKPTTTQRKRKISEDDSLQNVQIKLLKAQVEQNNALIDEMRAQAKNLSTIAKSLCGIENVMRGILNYLTDE